MIESIWQKHVKNFKEQLEQNWKLQQIWSLKLQKKRTTMKLETARINLQQNKQQRNKGTSCSVLRYQIYIFLQNNNHFYDS